MSVQGRMVPEGFQPAVGDGGLFDQLGPYYERRSVDGRWRFGMHIDRRHANVRGVCHGGVLVSFIDQVLGKICWEALENRIAATINLATDFVAPARIGDWIEAEGEVTSMTGSLVFLQGRVLRGDEVVAAARGIWKVIGKRATRDTGGTR